MCMYEVITQVFYPVSKHFEVVKKNSAASRFSTHFSVVGYPDEILFLLFDILLESFLIAFCAFSPGNCDSIVECDIDDAKCRAGSVCRHHAEAVTWP